MENAGIPPFGNIGRRGHQMDTSQMDTSQMDTSQMDTR